MKTRTTAVCAVLLLAGSAWADSLTLHWNELSPVLAHHTVSLTAPDGTRIKGRAVSVDPDQLVIETGGNNTKIPRAQVKTLEVNHPTKLWRIVGTATGAVLGLVVGVLAAIAKNGLFSNSSDNGIVIGVAAGITAGGFLLGWAADRRRTTVVVLSD